MVNIVPPNTSPELPMLTITGNTTLDDESPSILTWSATSNYTITLPQASSCPGKIFTTYVTGTSGFTWSPASGDKIHNLSANTTLFVSTSGGGTPVISTLMSNGVDGWIYLVNTSGNIRTSTGALPYFVQGGTLGPSAINYSTSTGSLQFTVAGMGVQFKEGTNAIMGTATLVAGSATVSTTKVTASSRIFLTSNTDGGTPGWLRVSARSAGTNFTITSSSGTDTSTVAWLIVEPS